MSSRRWERTPGPCRPRASVDVAAEGAAGPLVLLTWLVSGTGRAYQPARSRSGWPVGHPFCSRPAPRVPWRCVCSPPQPSAPLALALSPLGQLSRLRVFSGPPEAEEPSSVNVSSREKERLPSSFPDPLLPSHFQTTTGLYGFPVCIHGG